MKTSKIKKVTISQDVKMCGCAIILRAGEQYELVRSNSKYAYIKMPNGVTVCLPVAMVK